jgi:hypothetical protein
VAVVFFIPKVLYFKLRFNTKEPIKRNTIMNINRKYRRIVSLLILVILVTGCATMDQSECTMANWNEIGVNDGQEGKKATYYSEYQKDCSGFGITVDTEAYKEGWNVGISNYCTSDNGYSEGAIGRFYQNSCPAEYESEFFSAFQMGRAIHTQQLQVNRLRREIQKTGDDLGKVDATAEQRSSLSEKRKRLEKDVELANIRLVLSKTEARRHGFSVAY